VQHLGHEGHDLVQGWNRTGGAVRNSADTRDTACAWHLKPQQVTAYASWQNPLGNAPVEITQRIYGVMEAKS
jgi:hypothetical protein